MNLSDLKSTLSEWGPVTVLLVIGCSVAAIGGAVVVIVQPATLSFDQYLNDMKAFAIALAGLGVGRGIMSAGKAQARATEVGLVATATAAPVVAAAAQPTEDELRQFAGDGDESLGAEDVPQ